MTNAVVDTNVLVSAAIRPVSVPRKAVDIVSSRGRLLMSEATKRELEEVLGRPRLNKSVTLAIRAAFFARVVSEALLVEITEQVVACRDRMDDKFLEVAVNGRATHLVTGDGDLLALHPFRGIPILSPAAFLAAVDPSAAP